MIKTVNNTLTYVIYYLNGKEIIGTFYEKELQIAIANQKEFRIEKVIKRKDCKSYVKWKRYNNLFNSCIDKKRHKSITVNIFQNRSL